MSSRSAVKERKPEATTAPVEAGACRHHWLIESPRGALSNGRCKVCGERRQFRNSANDYIWDDDSSSSGGYGRSGYGRGVLSGARPAPKAIDDDDVTASSGPGRGEVALVV